MAAIVTVFLMAWAVIACVPDIPVARRLHGWLVEAPSRFMARMTLGYMLLFGFFATAVVALAVIEGGDGVRVAMMALPEMTAWAATFEVATLVEALVAAGAAWSSLRAAAWWRPQARRRASRPAGRITGRRRAANDDDERRDYSSAA